MATMFVIPLVAIFVAVTAFSQQPELAPEGRGLLPKPNTVSGKLEGPVPVHPFEPDPSGGVSRIVFETNEDPKFHITIRDYAFPPDQRSHALTLPSGALLYLLGGTGEINVANQPLALSAVAKTVLPPRTHAVVMNKGSNSFILRALILEAK